MAGHRAVPGVTLERQKFLTFHLGEEMFTIGILSIHEIIEHCQLTEVPLAPSFIRRVLNLRGVASRHRPALPFLVWSAASPTGEETYSIAMALTDTIGLSKWDNVGTNISSRVLEKARSGDYSRDRIDGIPRPLLRKYCPEGMGEHDGSLLIARELRQRVDFLYNNLMPTTARLLMFRMFNVTLLRNVTIYFDQATKRKVIGNLLPYLKADEYPLIGHSEPLNRVTDDLATVRPTTYRRAGPHRTPSLENRQTEKP